MKAFRSVPAALVTVVFLASVLGAQSKPATAGARAQNAPLPNFEVASIKPNNSGRPGSISNFRAGRFTATNTTVQILIMSAYDIHEFQLAGGPRWITTDRFDVVATAPGDPDSETVRALLRSLLEERFALATHTETKELPVSRLIVT